MKKLIAFTMVFALLAPMLMRNVVLLHFYMNRDRIAKELCVEKDDVKSCCKGSCQLNKELGKVADETSHDQLPSTGKIEVLWEHSISDVYCSVYFGSAQAERDVYQEMQSCIDLLVTDRPPCC